MRTSPSRCLSMLLGALALTAPFASAQISLASAVDLALRNSPRVKMAQADLDKARAALAEAHDAYVPAIMTTGGVGSSTGVPLGLPVVFSISAQSLAFNFSQSDYVRSARAGVTAADLSMKEARSEVAEDTVTTYIALDNALQRRAANNEADNVAGRLVQIVQDRFDAGVEPHIEITKSKRTAAQIRLQKLQVEDEIENLSSHLARLTGVPGSATATVHDSIPVLTLPAEDNDSEQDSDGIKAAVARATSKGYVARGDLRYRWRPQFAFEANYSRISTAFNNYALYYPGFNTDRAGNQTRSFNSLGVGVQISVPLLDLVHQAKARGSVAEAARMRFEAENDRIQFQEGRVKLRRSAAELAARSELASLDRDLAQDQLDTIEVQLKATSAAPDSPQITPKDEQNARLQERQKYIEFLDAELQLRQTEVNYLRQSGHLGEWLHLAMPSQPAAIPAAVQAVPNPKP